VAGHRAPPGSGAGAAGPLARRQMLRMWLTPPPAGVGVDDVRHSAGYLVDGADPPGTCLALVLDLDSVAASPLLLVGWDGHAACLANVGSTL
jgi:hypothetical protein